MCVTRDVARQLFTERAESARRQREAAERQTAELAKQHAAHVRGGWPAYGDGVGAAAGMLAAARHELPRRRSVLETALSNEGVDGTIEYRPIRDGDEP